MLAQVWWKKWLSYLTEFRIEERNSAVSGWLEVTYKRDRYSLCTKNAVYSYADLYANFRDSFKRLPLDSLGLKKVLVLGMGLGSIPFLLEKQFGQDCEYTLVELDPVVIDLAKTYGCLAGDLSSKMDVVCADAAEFIAQTPSQTYDLIAIDIFVDNIIPAAVERIEFLKQLQNWLSPNGVLMYNRLTYNEKLMQKTLAFFEKSFKFVFNDAFFLELNGNRMLIHSPRLAQQNISI